MEEKIWLILWIKWQYITLWVSLQIANPYTIIAYKAKNTIPAKYWQFCQPKVLVFF